MDVREEDEKKEASSQSFLVDFGGNKWQSASFDEARPGAPSRCAVSVEGSQVARVAPEARRDRRLWAQMQMKSHRRRWRFLYCTDLLHTHSESPNEPIQSRWVVPHCFELDDGFVGTKLIALMLVGTIQLREA